MTIDDRRLPRSIVYRPSSKTRTDLPKPVFSEEITVLDRLTSADFTPYLNQTFTVQIDGAEPLTLELTQVAELGSAAAEPGAGRRPFSLLFLGPVSQQYLLQHIYRLEHEQLGELDLFLVPLGLEGGRMRYEAVFN